MKINPMAIINLDKRKNKFAISENEDGNTNPPKFNIKPKLINITDKKLFLFADRDIKKSGNLFCHNEYKKRTDIRIINPTNTNKEITG
jgi:hypothetical protein